VRNRVAALIAAVLLGVVALWWVFLYSPRGAALSDVRDDVASADHERIGLDSTLARLEEIDANGPATDARLASLSEALPTNPDLAGFINGAHEIALDAGIDWISVAPAEPAVIPGAPPTIRLNIQIEGGFFQVLDYLNRLEDLDRLVIVDSINITTGGTGASGEGGATTPTTGSVAATGAPDLSVTLTARMFTLSTLSTPAATTPPASEGTTVTTTAPRGTTTTAPVAPGTTQVLS